MNGRCKCDKDNGPVARWLYPNLTLFAMFHDGRCQKPTGFIVIRNNTKQKASGVVTLNDQLKLKLYLPLQNFAQSVYQKAMVGDRKLPTGLSFVLIFSCCFCVLFVLLCSLSCLAFYKSDYLQNIRFVLEDEPKKVKFVEEAIGFVNVLTKFHSCRLTNCLQSMR